MTIASPSRRDMLLGGAMAVAAGTAFARMPHHRTMMMKPSQLGSVAPLKIGSWRYQTAEGIVLPPPDQLAQLLYDGQVARAYVSPVELPVMLLLAYGSSQNGMLQIHRPETCYPASGYRLTATREERMPVGGGRSIWVRRFTATSATRIEQVLYWTRIGETLPLSWAAERLAVMRSNLAGDIPDGLLVRMSALSQDVAAADQALVRFARTLLDGLDAPRRHMLIAGA